ncbi:MAG TPA: DUF3237 family protein [Novosphingobium sp.]|nr:DUF3237 family protein [Novosphingobium sp.]
MAAPTPGLEQAFTLILDRAPPVDIGATGNGGARSHVALRGGTFAWQDTGGQDAGGQGVGGQGWTGEGTILQVVAGSETLMRRADGVCTVEAQYLLRGETGACLRLFGTGHRLTQGDFAGLRLALLVEAAEDGPFAPLATRVYLGEQAEGAPAMTIWRIT